ncbi:hypothetical protein OBV_40880 [Oscillibacter valericigenes Sjm18-20]|nr:hypothetical protein OBV_40880 [Oscillibacter valericigenes Sjm18-20]
MCGRYQFTAEDNKEIQRIVQEVQDRCGRGKFMPGDVYPSAKAPVLLEAHGNVTPDLLYWGLQTSKALVINARSETAEQRSLFRDSFEQRRCVIPSTGFYEWSKDKRKYFFRLPDQPILYMAGIYQERDGKNCYCILTTEANASVRKVHPRMPVVLTPELLNTWIMDPAACRELLRKIPPQLLATAEDNQTSLW